MKHVSSTSTLTASQNKHESYLWHVVTDITIGKSDLRPPKGWQ